MPRKPVLNAELRARGSRKSYAKRDPISIPGDKTPPEGLAGVGLDTWQTCVEYLDQLGIWSVTDRHTIETYCQLRQFQQEAAAELRAEGITNLDDKANKKVSPAWRVYNEASTSLRALAQNLGFDPTSRQRLTGRNASTAKTKDDRQQPDNIVRFFGGA